MIMLRKRFEPSDIVSAGDKKKMKTPFGMAVLMNERTLQLEMNSGSSCGLGDNVFAFASDANGVWYVTYRDYLRGLPWVYCVLFKDMLVTFKGILEDDGSYVFHDGASVLSMDKEGSVRKVCSILSAERLVGYEGSDFPLTFERINRYLSCLRESDEEEPVNVFYELIKIHRAVDKIAYGNGSEYVSVTDMARAVIDILKLADKNGVSLQSELERLLKHEIYLKKGDLLGERFRNEKENETVCGDKSGQKAFTDVCPDTE